MASTGLSTLRGTGIPPITAAADITTDFARIVASYRELQIGSDQMSPARKQAVSALDEVAVSYDAAMNVGSQQLWSDLPTGPGSEYFPSMFYRLRTTAVDWATPGSALSARADMPQRISTALNTLYDVQYNENTSEIGNWYVYEIGVPYWLLQIVVTLGSELSTADIQRYLRPILRFVADPNTRTATPGLVETGANRADKSLITVVSGALVGDANRVATGIAAVTDTVGQGAASLVTQVTTGDGYHTDGSFIQHGVVPYTGHYALVLLTAIANLIHVTAGTNTQLALDVSQKFYDAVTDVYAPFVFEGSMMEPVRGRMLSRQGETGHDAGHQLIAATVLLARNAPRSTGAQLGGLAAKWINEGTYAPYLQVSDVIRFAGGLQPVGVPEVEYAEQLLASRPAQPANVPTHRPFPQMDRMVHATGSWSAALGLSSTRICRYEAINGQNLHGWYVGDGVVYTFRPNDQGHYSDAYWPTVDATLLPGTTEKDSTPPPTAFAGGARFDDGYGAYGLDFISQDGTLSAKKSWFFTPDAVICLGAGITDTSGADIRTTIENRNLGENGTAALLVDGAQAATRLGQPTVLSGVHRLSLDGVAGYVLLEDDNDPITLLREDRTGTWLGIDTGANTHGTDVPYTRRYQKIVLGHGRNPSGGRYAYAVVPGATDRHARDAVADCRVLANTVDTQAVRLDGDVTAATFFAAGMVGQVAVSGPACALWGRQPDRWMFTLSDPTQTQDTVRVTVDLPGRRVVHADPTVTVVATHPRLVVDIRVAGSFGATHTFSVR